MNIAILGLGLIGGSIAAALKKYNKKITVVAYDQNITALKYAQKTGLIDQHTNSIKTAITNAAIIVIAAPVGSYANIFCALAKHITATQIITDVCSVKGAVIEIAKRELKQDISQFVPGHPIAGSEKSGVKNAQADLFTGHHVILTPTAKTTTMLTRKIISFWQNLGAIVDLMSAKQHDEILAATSHLPHVLSYAYMNMFSRRKNIMKYSAKSFADMTRIATSDTTLWYDIFRANSKALLAEIKIFKKQLCCIENAVRKK